MHPHATAAGSYHSTDDALAKLLQAEARLAERVAAARLAAEETLAQARVDAERIEQSCAETIAASCAALTAEYEARSDAELAQLAESARTLAARFEQVAPEALREYVAFIIERLLPRSEPST